MFLKVLKHSLTAPYLQLEVSLGGLDLGPSETVLFHEFFFVSHEGSIGDIHGSNANWGVYRS